MTLLAAVAGAAMISFSAILFGLSETSPTTGAFFREAYAVPVLAVIWLAGRSRDRRPMARRWIALGSGLALGADTVVWHQSIDYIGAGLATLIANTSVVFVAVGAWLFLKEKPRPATMVAIPVILIGVTLVSGAGQGDAYGQSPLLGTGLAIAAAVFYAIFMLAFRHSNVEQAPGAGPLLEATFGGMVTTLLVAPITGGIDFAISWPSHGWLLTLAISSQVIGWLLIGYALPRLPAVETATIILLQPALTMVWGALIFAERPSTLQILGAVVVLAGVAFVAAARAWREPEPAVV